MPTKVTLEDGTETEMYSKEELDAQREGAINEFKEKNPDKSEELTALQSELAKANEDLAKFKDKDLNFGELRKQKDAAEKRVADLAKEMDTKLENTKKEILEGVMKDHYQDTIKAMTNGDAELQKKVEYHYKRLTDNAATKEEITKKLTDAWTLATKVEDPGALTAAVISSGGVHKPNINSSQPYTADERALAQRLATAGGLGQLDEKDFR